MRGRFLKRCKCEDDGYITLEKSEVEPQLATVKYLDVTVHCRKCGMVYRELPKKGKFDPQKIFTDAKPVKAKTPKIEKPKVEKEKKSGIKGLFGSAEQS